MKNKVLDIDLNDNIIKDYKFIKINCVIDNKINIELDFEYKIGDYAFLSKRGTSLKVIKNKQSYKEHPYNHNNPNVIYVKNEFIDSYKVFNIYDTDILLMIFCKNPYNKSKIVNAYKEFLKKDNERNITWLQNSYESYLKSKRILNLID